MTGYTVTRVVNGTAARKSLNVKSSKTTMGGNRPAVSPHGEQPFVFEELTCNSNEDTMDNINQPASNTEGDLFCEASITFSTINMN